MWFRVLLGSVLWAALGASWPGGVQAREEAPPAYREVIDRALQEHAAARFEEAYVLLKQAHEIWPNAGSARALGMTCYELLHFVEAGRWFEQALALERRRLTGARRAEVIDLMARARADTARVQLQLSPPDAEVWLEGRRVLPSARGEISLDPGEYRVEFRSDGHLSQGQRLILGAGESREIELALSPITSVSGVVASPEQVALEALEGGPSGLEVPVKSGSETAARPIHRRWWVWTAVGVVAAVATTALLVMSDQGEVSGANPNSNLTIETLSESGSAP